MSARLLTQPVALSTANPYVHAWHRHSRPVVGHLWSLGLFGDGGAGYSVRRDNGRREGMWLSPACLFGHHQDSLITGETA